jgi:tetratricopeptide (TPR) repeat protein
MQSRDLRSLALLTRGYAFGLEEEFDKAFVDINEVIRRDPGNPKAYAIRAKLYFMQGKYQAAREDCDRGEALAPRLRDWVITRGSSLSRERHHDKAIPELDKAIKLCPLSAGLFTERATCFYELHKHELAVADLNTAARLTPNDQQIYILRSRVWLAQRDYRRALQDYDTCLRLNPKHLLVMHWKALLLATCVDARVRNGREAVNTAQRMCELSEWCWPPFVSTLAAAHAELGDFQEARRLEHKAQELEEQPTFPYRSGSRRLQFYQQNKPLREGANPVTSLQPKMQLHLFGNKRDCPQFAQGYNISGN